MNHPNPQVAESVQVMVACGLTPRAIAKELGLTEDSLNKHYRDDLDHGLEVANAKVAKVFFDLATSGDHPALTKAWAELRGGWASSSRLQIQDDTDQDLAREKLLKLLNRPAPTSKASSASQLSSSSPSHIKAVK